MSASNQAPDLAPPAPTPNPAGEVIRMGHPEEGERRGEGWAVAKGLIALVAAIAIMSFLIR